MGCKGSKSTATVDASSLSEDKKKKVRESWEWFVADENLKENACRIFFKLFEQAPDTVVMFSFIEKDKLSEEELMNSPGLQMHAGRVVDVITFVIHHMDQEDTVTQAVKEKGARHYHYGAKPEHVQPVANGIMYTLKTTLKDRFTAEHEKAWSSVLALVGDLFVKGWKEESDKEMNEESAKGKKGESSRGTVEDSSEGTQEEPAEK